MGKSYLEYFYNFCSSMGETTSDVMCEILAFEADRRAFIITINSFGTELTKDDREKLYPTCGRLSPDGLKALARADDYDQVRQVADYYSEYRACFEGAGVSQHCVDKRVRGSETPGQDRQLHSYIVEA